MAMITDEDWEQWTSREIARHCGFSDTFVNKCRDELLTANVCSEKSIQDRKYVTKHGNESVMKTANIGKKPVQAEPVKEPASEFEGQDFGPSEGQATRARMRGGTGVVTAR
jgi:hypothetical protein